MGGGLQTLLAPVAKGFGVVRALNANKRPVRFRPADGGGMMFNLWRRGLVNSDGMLIGRNWVDRFWPDYYGSFRVPHRILVPAAISPIPHCCLGMIV